MVTVILLITKVGILYTYGGEFGGFDIDIGADEGIFDNWEEAEGNQETTEPEQKENEKDYIYIFEALLWSNGNWVCD